MTEEYISREIPQIYAVKGDATYLLWLDCTRIFRKEQDLCEFIRETSGLYLSDGRAYHNGEGFLRMNLACRMDVLKDGLQRLKKSIQAYCK